jgi:chloramphenicol O-acetyltransferase type A
MRTQIDISNWNRKEVFNFYKNFDEPYFGVVVNVDVTDAFAKAKTEGISFFVVYLYCATRAVNELKPFRLRIQNDEVWDYEHIEASAVISRSDGTFGFSYIPYHIDIQEFKKNVQAEIDRIEHDRNLMPSTNSEAIIHFSSLPWLQFTSLSHARHYGYKDSVPKISFGKTFQQDSKLMMPTSVHVHHALIDGADVGEFVDLFQKLLNEINLTQVYNLTQVQNLR